MSQNEQNENGNVDILAKEIESWNDFRYALREENALLFNKMLSECGQNNDYVRVVVSKGDLLLVLQRQKMINELLILY